MMAPGTMISPFSHNTWVVNTPDGRNFLVTESTARLYDILLENRSLQEAYPKFRHTFNCALSFETFEALVERELSFYRSRPDEANEDRSRRKNYLPSRWELLPARWAGLLSRPLVAFFDTPLFIGLSIVLTTFGAFFLYRYPYTGVSQLLEQPLNYLPALLALVLTPLVHELGHIAACRKYGIRHGGIGIAIYIIFPVAYCDISQLWTASRRQRVIANLGGVFAQSLYASLFGLAYGLTNEATYAFSYLVIVLTTAAELYPFVRSDGYWLLSDLLHIPNLLPRAQASIQNLLRGGKAQALGTTRHQKTTAMDVFVLSYGLFNYLAVLYLGFAFVQNWGEEIIGLPAFLSALLVKAFLVGLRIEDFPLDVAPVVLFYAVLIRFLYIGTKYSMKKIYHW
jgi:putative peptide zinc metalloprotease protein